MKKFIYQTNNNECGFACLKMMLAIINNDEQYLYLPHKKHTDEKYSLLELKDIAKEEGAFLSGYLINNERDLLNLKTPFILIKTLANGNKHAVLINKITRMFVIVSDPDKGRQVMISKKLFRDLGSGVEVLALESYTRTSFKYEARPLVSNKEKGKIVVLEILAIFAYFFSAYFIDHESHFLYPVVLMVIGVLFAIIYKIVSYNVMKKFDDEYIRFTYSPNKEIRRKNYEIMHQTKSGLLATTSNMILTLASTLMLNIILILGNRYAIFVLLGSTVLVLIDAIFITPKIKNRASKLEKSERESLDKENLSLDEYLNDYQTIKDSTYKIAKLIDFKRIIMFFVLLILVILMSGVTENANINFVLFFFAMSMFTYTSLDNVFKMIDNNKVNIINQTKFYDLINEFNEKEKK